MKIYILVFYLLELRGNDLFLFFILVLEIGDYIENV